METKIAVVIIFGVVYCIGLIWIYWEYARRGWIDDDHGNHREWWEIPLIRYATGLIIILVAGLFILLIGIISGGS